MGPRPPMPWVGPLCPPRTCQLTPQIGTRGSLSVAMGCPLPTGGCAHRPALPRGPCSRPLQAALLHPVGSAHLASGSLPSPSHLASVPVSRAVAPNRPGLALQRCVHRADSWPSIVIGGVTTNMGHERHCQKTTNRWEEVPATRTSDEGLISTIYKGHPQLNNSNKIQSLKNGQRSESHLSKEDI